MKNIYLLFSILFLSNAIKAINITSSITSGGVTRNFIIHAPGASVGINLPVVYVLHGDGGTGAGIKSYSGFDSIADQNNFIAVYPTAYQAGGLWNKYVDFAAGDGGSGNATAPDDVVFFSDLTDYLCTTYQINTAKVYATGHSGGAYMCYNLALQLQNKIAGIAPVAGSCWGDNTALSTLFTGVNYKKMPIYHVHGDADATVTYPDANHMADPWGEWPFSFFGNYGCGNSTYTSTINLPGTTVAGAIKKLEFCGGPAPANKEVLLIRIVGGGHGWPSVAGYKPAKAMWDFFNQYALSVAPGCTPPPPPPPVLGTVVGGIAGPNTSNYIHTSGRFILGSMGDTIVMRGVNYAPYNWGYDALELRLNQIALSNANTVRLVWYANGGGAPVYPSWTLLDSAISKCAQLGLIAVPELHDVTCTNDSVAITNLLAWWTNPAMQTILDKYKGYVIVNFANEALGSGAWGWLGGSAAQYKNIYANIITQLRSNVGFNYPIMIDAPDCGGNENAIINNATATYLTNLDPLQNIMYSVHTYWPTPSNTATVLQSRLTAMQASNIPFVLGEVAGTTDCSDVILIDSLLKYAKQKDLGWLVWSWDRDNCAARQVTTNGLANSLTPYGNTIVNNLQFGLVSTAIKMLPPAVSLPLSNSGMLLQNNNGTNFLNWNISENLKANRLCISHDGANFTEFVDVKNANTLYYYKEFFTADKFCKLEALDANKNISYSNMVVLKAKQYKNILVMPNPAANYIQIPSIAKAASVQILNVTGQILLDMQNVFANSKIDVSSLQSGVYTIQIVENGKVEMLQLMKK